jgi:glutathione S-transferase
MELSAASDIILHHYPRSPFAEKMRVALGLKRVAWRSVVQPRIAPKPMLTSLTGGYRRIPVMQIGADIYCDTRCILSELELRFPQPSFYSGGTRGHADVFANWSDRCLFPNALGLVFGLKGDSFPPELHADRARFTAGKFDGWDSARMREQVPALRDQLRTHLAWLDDCMADGRPFLLGDEVSIADIAVYHPIWYARGNLGDDAGLDGFSKLRAWMDRMATIGHGTSTEMSPQEALQIARTAQPQAGVGTLNDDPQWKPGMQLSVIPVDWGFDAVIGECVSVTPDAIALRRHDPVAGDIIVHFPRAGFGITQSQSR